MLRIVDVESSTIRTRFGTFTLTQAFDQTLASAEGRAGLDDDSIGIRPSGGEIDRRFPRRRDANDERRMPLRPQHRDELSVLLRYGMVDKRNIDCHL